MPQAQQPSKPLPRGCLALFGLPFLGAGALVMWQALAGHRHPTPEWAQLAFGGVFALVGGGLMLAGPIASALAGRRRAREAAAPDEPWRWRDDWAAGRIRGSLTAGGGVHWLFGLLWLAISLPMAWFLFHKADVPIFFQSLFGIGFPIVGILLLIGGVQTALRRQRFGRSWLTLDYVPAPPGGALSGRIDCGVEDQLEPTFRLVLHCAETWTESRGKNSNTRTEVLWRDEYECRGERSADAPDGSLVPVRFDLPAAAMPCGPGARGTIAWRLQVSSELPGVDYRDGFDVPVFAAPAGAPERSPRPRPHTAARERLATGRLVLTDDGGETRVVFPPALNPGLATVPTVLLAITGYMTWAWWREGLWYGYVPAGLFAAAMLWAAARAWLMRTTVVVRRGEIEVERSLLWVAWRRTWRAGEVEDLELANDFSSGGDPWYRLSLSGPMKTKVGSLIQSKGVAERARDALSGRFKG